MTPPAPVKTTCPYCGVGCGVLAAANGKIAGDPEHPANRGRLCSKGVALAETLIDAGRLLRPQIGNREASWEEALDRIADGFSRVIAEHGPDAVALYVSGQFLTEDYYVANKLMKGFIGSANIDTNSRLCMASSVAGHIRAFGEDIVPGCYEDIEAADLVVLIGSNMAWCHPVLYQRLAAAKEARGTRVVVVDPRRTATCEIADLHLALRPGSDVAVFAGLLVHLAESGVCDATPAQGFEGALTAARAAAPSIEAVAALADLPVADLARFYDWFAATERTVTLYSQGVNQSSAGTDKVNAIVNCHLATGRIGRPGMGPLSLTGQPNAMGGREVGGLANQLAAHMGFDQASIDRVRRFWNAPRIATKPGLKAVELFDAVLAGRVKALWIMGTNPADSMPRAARVREALTACPLVVVSDCWPTDTTRFADIVLPAAGWGEKDGTVTNSERRISRQRAFRPPPGEARPDWWALGEVARRLGWGRAFAYRGPADIFREHAALSAFENDGGRLFDIAALAAFDDEAYDTLAPVQWPVSAGAVEGTSRLFTKGKGFPTPDGKARFVATPYRALAEPAGAEFPLVLNTGRVRDQWHTMTRTGSVPRLMTHRAEPFLEIHPNDAERYRLSVDGLARVETRHGASVLPVLVTSDQRPGEVFVPMHWSDGFASAGPVARLVGAVTDPVSGQPELKGTPARVSPVAALWRGLLLRRDGLPAGDSYYWARTPLEEGHAFDLAGWEPLPSGRGTETWVAELMGSSPDAEMVIFADPARGIFRYATIVEERLEACLFLARRRSELPAREGAAATLRGEISAAARLGLLCGRAANDTASGDPTVCTCFGVSLRTLHAAIAGRRLSTVAEIGSALRAGTNCGSCVPELKAVLRAS
ncbi:MAG TPA: molybdopterin-dependent oxidoreductase [Stellaceae bacterium]|jgi:assimilatory nitrate reductase catalytic subunit|nr:molybdopterin-dependent oxidoreductase [Stellaceae bacterium]